MTSRNYDLGAASLEAARLEPSLAGASWEALVIHAAKHPVTPLAGTDRDTPERPGTDADACDACGTLLDPDGACLTCTSREAVQ